MDNTNIQNKNKADLRDNLAHLDEKTREVYLRSCSENASHYDPSVFVEALVDEAGTMHLFVPAKKRVAWFKTDYPEGIVAPDPPQYVGRRVTITVRIYKNRDDFRNNLPAAVNMATRVLNDNDAYCVDTCVTRAQSRALRDLGYDLPRDAHYIDGWTPTQNIKKDLPDDALESSMTIADFMPTMAPTVPGLVPVPETAPAQVSEPAAPVAANNAKQTDEGQKPTEEEQGTQPEPPAKRRGRPRKTKATEGETETKPIEPATLPEGTEPVQTAMVDATLDTVDQTVNNGVDEMTAVELANNESAETPDLLDRAKGVFATVGEAEGYTSRIIGGKTVAEQPEMRIIYFARKAMAGSCRDEKLGLAAYMVAKDRRYQI